MNTNLSSKFSLTYWIIFVKVLDFSFGVQYNENKERN